MSHRMHLNKPRGCEDSAFTVLGLIPRGAGEPRMDSPTSISAVEDEESEALRNQHARHGKVRFTARLYKFGPAPPGASMRDSEGAE